jgi:hypothetical protein
VVDAGSVEDCPSLTASNLATHDVAMSTSLPITNTGDEPLSLWVQPFLFEDMGLHDRYDFRMPPGACWSLVSERDLEIAVEVGFRSLLVLVRGGVHDVEVVDETGAVQGFAQPPLGSTSPGGKSIR